MRWKGTHIGQYGSDLDFGVPRIIINIGAFKKFTVGYRQYLIYKTTVNNNMDINII